MIKNIYIKYLLFYLNRRKDACGFPTPSGPFLQVTCKCILVICLPMRESQCFLVQVKICSGEL